MSNLTDAQKDGIPTITGLQGIQGIQGVRGTQGIRGRQGVQGIIGKSSQPSFGLSYIMTDM